MSKPERGSDVPFMGERRGLFQNITIKETVNKYTKILLPTNTSHVGMTRCLWNFCAKAIHTLHSFIKGTSLLPLRNYNVKASMTVEASMVLPLFLFFVLNLLSAIEMIRLHSNVSLALWNVGREMAVYGSFAETESKTLKIGLVLAEGATVKHKITKMLGQTYLDTSTLKGGDSSLYCMVLPNEEDPDILDIRVVSRVAARFPLPAFREFSLVNTFYSHYFRGYETPPKEAGETYYVTPEGAVYHMRQTCSYLYIPVEKLLRNDERIGQYRACIKCRSSGGMPWVFVTKEGECFHTKIDCSAIKRTIIAVTDVSGYRPCSRCAAVGGE